MKKHLVTIALSITMGITFASVVSCRNNDTNVEHHIESGSVEDNAVDNPSTAPVTDSTQMGVPANEARPDNGSSNMTPPDSIKPRN